MVMYLINIKVHDKIEEWFGDSMAFDLVYVEWIEWFNGTFKKEWFDGEFIFRDIAQSSFDYVEGTCEDMNNSMIAADEVSSVE